MKLNIIIYVFICLGMYCPTEGLPVPTQDCSMGYYCPAGQVTDTPDNYTCPLGHFCLTGRATPEPCPSGSYQVGINLIFLLRQNTFCKEEVMKGYILYQTLFF